MKVAIVTGVSKGLGEAVAQLLLTSKIGVVGLSRTKNDQLQKVAEKHNIFYQHYVCDLGQLTNLQQVKEDIFNHLKEQSVKQLYLVNNAAVLQPIDQGMNISSEDLAHHVQVNTVAPMVLTNYFLKKATELSIPLNVMTVTSGAAERPVYGWSAYCSTKASINMYTKTAALEQNELQTGHKVMAFSPGVMDTNMQAEIRGSSREAFKDVDRFKKYKEEDYLKSATEVGQVLVDLLLKEKAENGKIYDVNAYL